MVIPIANTKHAEFTIGRIITRERSVFRSALRVVAAAVVAAVVVGGFLVAAVVVGAVVVETAVVAEVDRAAEATAEVGGAVAGGAVGTAVSLPQPARSRLTKLIIIKNLF